MNNTQSRNEPSAELQQLADVFVRNHAGPQQPRDKLLSDWCEHLQDRSPETLELPVMQLIKAIVRAGRHRVTAIHRLHAQESSREAVHY